MMVKNLSYLVWFLNSALLVALLVPVARWLAHRLGLMDHPGGQSYKWHHRPTALLGGAPIIIAVAVSALIGQTLAAKVGVILIAALLSGVVGFLDDRRSLGVLPKLLPGIAGALALWFVGIRVGLTGIYPLDLLLTVGWVALVTQSLNVIDNMDGVATGLTAVAALGFFTIGILHDQTRVALMAISIAGACLALLPFNYRGATIFLGDAGTLSLGFLLAALGLANDLPGTAPLTRVVVPTLVLGVPLFNTLLVTVSRIKGRRRVTVGGTDGIAHRLVALGLSRDQAAVVFWIGGGITAVGGIVISTMNVGATVIAVTAASLIALIGIWAMERVHVPASPSTVRVRPLLGTPDDDAGIRDEELDAIDPPS